MRARDLGIDIGLLAPGPSKAISDVAGVRVGHVAHRLPHDRLVDVWRRYRG